MIRTITAKYAGECPHCTGGIRLGDKVRFAPRSAGAKVWHLDCEAAARSHRAADRFTAYRGALEQLRARFADAPIVDDYRETLAPLEGDRVCLSAGFPSWSEIAYLGPDRCYLWHASTGGRPPEVRALPRTDEIEGAIRAAAYVRNPDLQGWQIG